VTRALAPLILPAAVLVLAFAVFWLVCGGGAKVSAQRVTRRYVDAGLRQLEDEANRR
jgi:hypothetical protein